MNISSSKTNTWIVLWVLWILALLFIGKPSLADDAQELTSMPAPQNLFEVSYSAAADAVNQSLTEKGVGDKVSSTINGRTNKPIFAYSKPVTVEVRGLKYEKQSGHWDASLAFVADGEVVSALPAAGHFDEMIEVAVLKREMRNGDIIHESDVEIRDFSLNHTRVDTVNDLSALIGKTPARSISPFRPVRTAEVVAPAVIKKDALVQMRYSLPGMEISTSGQAMMGGAKGDVITVRNLTSKKIVRAVIENSETVSISSTNQETSQLAGDSHAAN